MILRLFRGSAPVERRSDVAASLSGRFATAARAFTGLTSYAVGLRTEGSRVRFVLASTWASIDDVMRQTGGLLDRPAHPLLHDMAPELVEHYELVGEPLSLIVGPRDGILRVATMRVRQGREEEFYRIVRRGLQGPAERGDLLAYYLGRRSGPQGDEAAAVSVWRSLAALGQLVGAEVASPLWGAELEPLLDQFDVEHFDALAAVAHEEAGRD